MEKISFKEQQFKVREDSIVDAANALLSQKGYELMTMDDIATAVGVSKGILYKHFPSKEAVAAAAMIRMLNQALGYLESLPPDLSALDRIKAGLVWTLRCRVAGSLPLLPSASPALQNGVMANLAYVALLMRLNSLMTRLIEAAIKDGDLRIDLPPDVMLHTIYARTCDPAFEFLRRTGRYNDDEVIDYLVRSCFGGLLAPSTNH